ncbi:hypothetical protein AOLI_G00142800 [Acnodon oligacanthus]
MKYDEVLGGTVLDTASTAKVPGNAMLFSSIAMHAKDVPLVWCFSSYDLCRWRWGKVRANTDRSALLMLGMRHESRVKEFDCHALRRIPFTFSHGSVCKLAPGPLKDQRVDHPPSRKKRTHILQEVEKRREQLSLASS